MIFKENKICCDHLKQSTMDLWIVRITKNGSKVDLRFANEHCKQLKSCILCPRNQLQQIQLR